MRVSNVFGETLRRAPAEAEHPVHQLLLRAGYIRQLAPGVFSYLPLAWKSVKKIQNIIMEELTAIGGQEVTLPLIHPAEILQKSGRWDRLSDGLFRLKDNRDREWALASTSEEVATVLANSEIHSYRQLPQLIFQNQPKFRDETQVRGGLLRTREFLMNDAYSFDRDETGGRDQYFAHHQAYYRIATRLNLPLLAIKGSNNAEELLSHEFVYRIPMGEDYHVSCPHCGYAANQAVAEFVKEAANSEEAQKIEKVHTPDASTIEAVSDFLGIGREQTAKIVFFRGDFGAVNPPKLIIAVVRGDMEVNHHQILNLTKAYKIQPAEGGEIEAAGCVPGFASPIGIDRKNVIVVVDDLVANSTNLVTGANEPDYHLLNSNCGRDYKPDMVGHISLAEDGAKCPDCRQPMNLEKGIEIGHLHQLGTYFSEAFNATFLDENGQAQFIHLGAYGIGIGRLFACIADAHRDKFGLSLPISMAPFPVGLILLKGDEKTTETAEAIYTELLNSGIEVLYDDRDVSAGVKFNDADLRGMPLRITVGDRALKKGGVEVKHRNSRQLFIVPVDQVVSKIKEAIKALEKELKKGLETVNRQKD